MVFSALPMVVLAAEGQCNHVHDSGVCGYVEGTADCTHVHDTACGGVVDSAQILSGFKRIETLNLNETVRYHKTGDTQGDPTGTFDPTSTNSPADNSEGWAWDLASRTLTLAGLNLQTTYDPTEDNYGISAEDSITIVLADGSSNLVEIGGLEVAFGEPRNFGICLVDGTDVNDNAVLTIQGGGLLTVTTGNGKDSTGIGAGSIIIGGTGNITVYGGSATAAAGIMYGIYASGEGDEDGVFINTKPGDRANVTSVGGKKGAISIGIESTVNLKIGGGVVRATGNNAVGGSYGMDAFHVEITGGTVYANAGVGTGSEDDSKSYGISARAASVETTPSVVKISGGAVYANGNKSYKNSYGIAALGNAQTPGQVTISGGTVYATGGETAQVQYDDCSSYGIYAGGDSEQGQVIITGGNVTAAGGASKNNSYGIYAEDLVRVSGGRVAARSESDSVHPNVSTAVYTANPAADPDDGSSGIVISGTGMQIINPVGGVLDATKQNILTGVGGTIAPYALIGVPTPSGGGSSGGGGAKSPLLSGGQSKAAPTNMPKPATAAEVSKLTEAALAMAKAANGKNATVALKNTSSATAAIFKQLADAAKKAGISITLTSDVTKANVVESRMYIDPAKAAQDMKLGVTLGDKKLEEKLSKLFGSALQVISLEQEGNLGMPVNMAVYLGGKTLDPKTLQLYSYNAKSNQITAVADAKCWIDANGYLRFTTGVGGVLVAGSKK